MKKCMTAKGYERFLFFSDAVVAFALTLLVVPLTDLAVELNSHGKNSSILDILTDNSQTWHAFFISFFVVMSMWGTHRKTFETAKTADGFMVNMNSFWLLTIICIPFASQSISGVYIKDNVVFYAVLLLVNTACIRIINIHVMKYRETLAHADAEFPYLPTRWITPAVSLLIIIIVASVPASGQYAFLLLLINTPIVAAYKKLRNKNKIKKSL